MIGRRRSGAIAVVVLASAVAACTANPPPPIESTDSPKTTAAQPTQNTAVVAIDSIGPGFNPHLLADQSPTDVAVSALVLPSPFRPVSSPTHPGTTDWVPDTSVIVSAGVTSQNPFTVTYRIRDDAQWSDGAPIAAEDFRYLWEQMTSHQGVVDPAGYDMISDVSSSGGGKTVTVTMKGRYPPWRELFTDLLPSHLVKDSPGGFGSGLADNIPVSGGRFHIKSVDRGRDEIVLERNDRFWATPAKLDRILLRRAGTPDQLADSMRSDDTQVAVVHGGDATKAQLSAIPAVRTATMFQPRVLELALNARAGPLADERVRRAMLAMLDPQLLATVGSGTERASEPDRAQILAPSDPGYAATRPPRMSATDADALLAQAGFQTVTSPSPTPPTSAPAPPRIVKDGKPLTVRVGAVENDDTAIAVANTAADQLRSAGVDASVRPLAADDLYGKSLLDGGVDAIVGWEHAGADPATVLASRYGCPQAQATQPSGPSASASPSPTDTTSAQQPPSNLSGVCDESLQSAIDSAIRGTGNVGEVLAAAEPKLWQLATVMPILQDETIVAAGPGVGGVSLSGPLQTGVFGDAAEWTRTKP